MQEYKWELINKINKIDEGNADERKRTLIDGQRGRGVGIQDNGGLFSLQKKKVNFVAAFELNGELCSV